MRKFFLPLAVLAAMLSTQVADAGFTFTKDSESFNKVGPTYGPATVTLGPGTLLTADFDPTGFQAQVLNSMGSDITDGLINFTIGTDMPGFSIEQVDIHESGAIIIAGDATASYSLTIAPVVTKVGNTAVSVPLVPILQTTESSNASKGWNFDVSMNVLNMYLASKSGADPLGPITEIEFAVDNTLVAETHNANSSAFIDKKDFSVTVPEPSSFLFLGLVLGGAAVWQKRRKVTVAAEEE